jgi:phage recombination protein Bet
MNETVATSDGLVSLPAIQEMAQTYKLSAKAFAFTFRAVAMPQPHTEAEFVSCCLVAREHGLNPLTKEIYFMRDKHGNIQAIVGIDGWIKKCNEHPQFDGLEFEHTHKADALVSIKARIFRKDRTRAIEITEFMSECVQVRKTEGPWQSHPSRMLRHRALAQCARVAFGFAGVMDREEFDQWQAMKDVTPAKDAIADTGCQSLPDLPEIPDIPDLPDISGESQDAHHDDLIADVDGFLADLEEQRSYCQSEDDLRELMESRSDLIERLPAPAKAKALKILEIEE